MADKEIIIDDVNVSECNWCDFEPNTEPYCRINDGEDLSCEYNPNCYFKQLKRQQYYLEKIRAYELDYLGVDFDEYEQHACDTEYSPIIDYVELALGEKDE